MTKISFIVVAYNAAQSLDALLGDLLSQTIAPEQLEALLVDSASTDDTAQIMRRFAARAPFEVKLLKNPKRGLASGINVALRAATGDAVIRLDAHARMPKEHLRHFLERRFRKFFTRLKIMKDLRKDPRISLRTACDHKAVTTGLFLHCDHVRRR